MENNIKDNFATANKLYTNGEYSDAYDMYMRIFEKYNDMDCYYNAGCCLLKLNDSPKAVSMFKNICKDISTKKQLRFNSAFNIMLEYFNSCDYKFAMQYSNLALSLIDDSNKIDKGNLLRVQNICMRHVFI